MPNITRRDRVYLSLRDDLMSGRISPDERLGEEKLAERYLVSRTPVREALARLVSDGLVERREHSWFPFRPRFDDLADLYELRTLLELHGIGRSSPTRRHDRAVLGPELDRWYEMRGKLPEPDAGFVSLDERFHMVLLESSGNRALCDALAAVNAKVRPVRMFDYLTSDRMAATVEEHIEIAELLLDDRVDDAHRALSDHIGTSRSVVIRRAEEARSLNRLAQAVQD